MPAVKVLFGSVSVSVLQSSVRDQKKLLVENSKLKKDIEQLRSQLQDKQRRRTRTLNSGQRQNNLHFRQREYECETMSCILLSFRQGFILHS